MWRIDLPPRKDGQERPVCVVCAYDGVRSLARFSSRGGKPVCEKCFVTYVKSLGSQGKGGRS